jgi:predicted alpha/beta hydrolase
MSVEPVRLALAGTGRLELPAWFYGAERAEGAVIVMAALGVSAKFYRPLAEALATAGLSALLLEQRGHGESPVRPGRRADWGFRESLESEIPAAIAWMREQDGSRPLYLLGHSLGGHYASMTIGISPERVDGVVLVGCASPWVGGFQGAGLAQLKLLHVLIPTTTRALGYFPGDRIGFGGREPRALMRDWVAFSKTNRYAAAGIELDLDAAIARYEGPVLSIRMTDDSFAPEPAVEAVLRKYENATITRRTLGPKDLGDEADHFRWARTPGHVVREILAWHTRSAEARVLA